MLVSVWEYLHRTEPSGRDSSKVENSSRLLRGSNDRFNFNISVSQKLTEGVHDMVTVQMLLCVDQDNSLLRCCKIFRLLVHCEPFKLLKSNEEINTFEIN